jgi:hypothetical protein
MYVFFIIPYFLGKKKHMFSRKLVIFTKAKVLNANIAQR